MNDRITVGFIPLLDCATLVAAVEQGFAAAEELDIVLMRETSWANIRDRLIAGHFDAAHMLAPMAVASSLGVEHVKVPLNAPFALGLGGNAITVSTSLWSAMVAEGATLGGNPRTLGAALERVISRRTHEEMPLRFGTVYPFSCHNYELRYWLKAVGIDPERDVRIVTIPPTLLAEAMREGQIDGFCAGEPWNSMAVAAGIGTIVTPTTAIWPDSPEKVLGCRASWAERNAAKLDALIRALYRSATWCEDPANHADLAQMLAAERYVDAPAHLIEGALANRMPLASGTRDVALKDFYMPARHSATFPWVSHALWFYAQMVRWNQVAESSLNLAAVRETYRPDLYRRALRSLGVSVPATDLKAETFFDEAVFDP